MYPLSIVLTDYFKRHLTKLLPTHPSGNLWTQPPGTQWVEVSKNRRVSYREGPYEFVHGEWTGDFPRRKAVSYHIERVVDLVKQHGAQHVLMIGLGPGLLIDALYEAGLLQTIHLVVVETHSASVRMVRDLLTGTVLADRVQLFHGKALTFFTEHNITFDVIFEDAFTDRGKPMEVWDAAFLNSARTRLAPGGLYVTHSHRNTYTEFMAPALAKAGLIPPPDDQPGSRRSQRLGNEIGDKYTVVKAWRNGDAPTQPGPRQSQTLAPKIGDEHTAGRRDGAAIRIADFTQLLRDSRVSLPKRVCDVPRSGRVVPACRRRPKAATKGTDMSSSPSNTFPCAANC